jgi:hypothetical protein
MIWVNFFKLNQFTLGDRQMKSIALSLIVGMMFGDVLVGARPQAKKDFDFHLWGPGSQARCGEWSRLKTADSVGTPTNEFTSRMILDSWILGFVSGVSYSRVMLVGTEHAKNVEIEENSREGMVAFVTQYCEAHPLDYLSDAVTALIRELHARAK